MKISRRIFIKTGTFGICAAVGLSDSVSASAQKNSFAEDIVSGNSSPDLFFSQTASQFKNYVGAEFMFITAEGAIPAILTKVKEASRNYNALNQSKKIGSSDKNSRNFILSFKMPSEEFQQANYQIWHPDFGTVNLFLVPDKRGEESFLMHAVINRL